MNIIDGKLYINGQWSEKELSRIEILNPANGELVGTALEAGEAESKLAIDAADEAFKKWSKTTAYERAGYLKKLNDLIHLHSDEIAKLITLEMGKPIHEAKGEVLYAASFIEWYAEETKRIYGEMIPSHEENKRMMVIKQPVGVVAAITPWNFPAAMITRKLGPALAAGCTIVIKPSELTPLTAIKLVELVEEAGFPKGVVNLVTGDAIAIGNEIMNNEKVKKVTFTGSTNVGKLLIKQSANQVKKLSMELGGHAPIIVFDDANIQEAIKGVISSKFRNAGQTCVCANRIYVHSDIYEDFVGELTKETSNLQIGNGLEERVDIGPIINEKALKKIDHHVKNAIKNGANCLLGGSFRKETNFYEPTILTNVNHNMIIMNEETFGPVLPIQKFNKDQEAIDFANHSNYGLAAYVYTGNIKRGMKVVESLDYGIIGWNDGVPSAAQAPFGGMKESGIGREGGHQGIEGFLETKYVSIGL